MNRRTFINGLLGGAAALALMTDLLEAQPLTDSYMCLFGNDGWVYANNEWYHVVGTRSGEGMQLYINGEQVESGGGEIAEVGFLPEHILSWEQIEALYATAMQG